MSILIIVVTVFFLFLNLFTFTFGCYFLHEYHKFRCLDSLVLGELFFTISFGTAGFLIPAGYFVFDVTPITIIFSIEFACLLVFTIIKYKQRLL